MFKFQEGDIVAVKSDYPGLLNAGDQGVVWGLYITEPPACEATFRHADGDEFDMTVFEDEVVIVDRALNPTEQVLEIAA